MKNDFLFNIGESVVYEHRSIGRPAKVVKRKRKKDYFLSMVHQQDIYINLYVVKECLMGLRGIKSFREFIDPEMLLRSADISMPKKAVDYESDELTANYLDASGNVLKTIKSGKEGYAHALVFKSLNAVK